MMSSMAGALLVQCQSRRFISALNSDPLMGSSEKILSQGKISSSIPYHSDDILTAGIWMSRVPSEPWLLVSLSYLPLATALHSALVWMEECTPPEQHICKSNSFSSLPTPSGFRVMPAWGHSAQSSVPVQLSLPMGAWTPQL